jgi:hypothetical protein
LEDYSYKEACEANGRRDWVAVEYNENSCIEVDVDYGVISKGSCGEIPGAVWYESADNEDSGNCGDGIDDSSGYEWKVIKFQSDTTWSSWNPGHFKGRPYGDIYGYPSFESPKLYESFTDYNVNGICDNEPFTDADSSDTNANGICDEVGDWSSRCPDNANTCKNVVVVEAGYKASNITIAFI